MSQIQAPSDPRLCMIGAGGHASRNVYPWIGKAGAELVGVCDLQENLARRNARRFGGTAYTDIDTMLDAKHPDGVLICIGPEQHADLAKKVIQRGLPVYTEKPPALSAADALDVARLAKDHSVLCVTGFKKRYAHVYDRAKRWIDGFDPSDHLSLAFVRASGHYTNDSLRRDLLLDFEIHMIDLAQFLFGDAAQVFAMTSDKHAYAVSIAFASGATGSINVSDGRSFKEPTEKVELTMKGGHFMSIDNSVRYRIAAAKTPTEWYESPTFTSAGDAGKDSGHFTELRDFVTAVRENQKVSRSSVAQSYRSMALYEAIATSAAQGRVVEPAYSNL